MELREYWEILWRRRWIIISVTVLAIFSNLLVSWQFAPPYKATIRLAVRPQIEARTEKFYNYDEYYAYVASEYLVDDVSSVVESRAFVDDLESKLQGKVAGIPLGAVEVKKIHRVMIVGVTLPSKDDALLAAQTVADLLTAKGSKYFANISWQNPEVQLVEPPSAIQVGENRRAMDLALRAMLGLFAGIGIALLLEYLGDTVRGAAQVERSIGLPVLGEIPQETSRLRKLTI